MENSNAGSLRFPNEFASNFYLEMRKGVLGRGSDLDLAWDWSLALALSVSMFVES